MDSLESCIRGDRRLAWPWFPRTLEFGAESPASWKPSQSGHTPGPGGWHLRTGEKHGGLLFCPSAGSCSLPGLGHQAAEQPPRLRAPAAFCCLCFCLTPGRNALGPQCAEGQGLDGDLSRRTEQQGKGAEFAAKTPPCLPPTGGTYTSHGARPLQAPVLTTVAPVPGKAERAGGQWRGRPLPFCGPPSCFLGWKPEPTYVV